MKPTIFISSTIYDLEDLRSSLKYWLEEAGYRVLLSDEPGFITEIEQNSYDACFEAIRRSQIFILLVGGRRGGWFNEDERVSITQQEYRVAYEEFQKGNLRIIPFVRRNVWDLNALYSEKIAKTDEATKAALNEKNQFVDDPAHLKEFIDEIRRLEEMRLAIRGGGPRPGGNWVHIFSDFREVIESLQVAIPLDIDISTEALLNSVSREVTDFIKQFVFKRPSGTGYTPDQIENLINQLPIEKEAFLANPEQRIVLDIDEVTRLAELAFSVVKSLPLIALERAAYSDSLTDYNPATNRVESSPLQLAIQRTYSAFREITEKSYLDLIMQFQQRILNEAAGSRGSDSWPIPAMTIVTLVGIAMKFRLAIAEAENLLNHLKLGQDLDPNPTLGMPVTPLRDEERYMAEEVVTEDEILDLIRRRKERN
ncbi:MAG: DUF4062 domain-containing protein [Thermoleophilia bacterium]